MNERFLHNLDLNQKQLLKGIPTMIPFKYPTLKRMVPGIIPGDQIIITASTGIGKSRFTRSMLIKDVIDYANKTGIKVKIFYNALEEDEIKVSSTLIAKTVFEDFGVRLDYYTTNGYKENPLTESQLRMIRTASDKVDSIYGPYMEVMHEPYPNIVYKRVREYLHTVGKFYLRQPDGSKTQIKEIGDMWDSYEYDEPTIVVVIHDTVDKFQPFKDTSLYETIKRFSAYYSRQLLGMKCKVISCFVSQQDPDLDRVQQNFKGETILGKLKPGLDTIRSCRAIQEDATLIFGLFDPLKYNEFNYNGYPNLRKLKYDYRALIALKTREGVLDHTFNEISLGVDFLTENFFELPKGDSNDIKSYLK